MASINDMKKNTKKEEKNIKSKIEDVKGDIKKFKEDDKVIDEAIKKEISDVKEDILNADAGLDKPENNFVQKVLFLVTGALNVFVGFSLYYIFRNDKKKKWIADCFLIGALIGIAFAIVSGLGEFLETLRELITK